MQRACGTYWVGWGLDENLLQGFVGETWRKETSCKRRCAWEGMDKINVTQDRGMWQGMNLLLPWNVGNFFISWEPLSFTRS
jgi:hypothetical protein